MMLTFNKYNRPVSGPPFKDTFYYCFPGLSQHSSLSHRVFTRHGGRSLPPYDSLNTSYGVGDSTESVDRNLNLINENINAEVLIHMNQQHGNEVVSLKGHPEEYSGKVFDADALVTDIPSVALMVKQADCQGVVLFAPEKAVTAVVHSGWKGSVENILGETVKRMEKDFDCCPENIKAAIGPSLGPCCAEFKTYRDIFPGHFMDYMVSEFNFDFWSVSEMQLITAGLKKRSIEKAGICTKCRTDIFFSYRGEGLTGRFATVAMLK